MIYRINHCINHCINLLIHTKMEAQPITQERYNNLVNENISLSDDNEHLKEQLHDLSKQLVNYASIIWKLVVKHNLSAEVNDLLT